MPETLAGSLAKLPLSDGELTYLRWLANERGPKTAVVSKVALTKVLKEFDRLKEENRILECQNRILAGALRTTPPLPQPPQFTDARARTLEFPKVGEIKVG